MENVKYVSKMSWDLSTAHWGCCYSRGRFGLADGVSHGLV